LAVLSRKESVTVVPQGEIALIVAADGASIPPQRILGKVVECDNFQNARQFLKEEAKKVVNSVSSPPEPTASTLPYSISLPPLTLPNMA
jgi:uncharacterized membrane protein YqiK